MYVSANTLYSILCVLLATTSAPGLGGCRALRQALALAMLGPALSVSGPGAVFRRRAPSMSGVSVCRAPDALYVGPRRSKISSPGSLQSLPWARCSLGQSSAWLCLEGALCWVGPWSSVYRALELSTGPRHAACRPGLYGHVIFIRFSASAPTLSVSAPGTVASTIGPELSLRQIPMLSLSSLGAHCGARSVPGPYHSWDGPRAYWAPGALYLAILGNGL